jgi:hypothetical protein
MIVQMFRSKKQQKLLIFSFIYEGNWGNSCKSDSFYSGRDFPFKNVSNTQ